jgi:hypothetical protein
MAADWDPSHAKVMDGIEYQRLEDGNLLIMKKALGLTTIRCEAGGVSTVSRPRDKSRNSDLGHDNKLFG